MNSLENLYLFGRDNESLVFAHELQAGRTYSIYVTTPGGLVNYRMYDQLKVVSLQPLLVQVVGREKDEISLTGEKITLEQLDLALRNIGLTEETIGHYPPVIWAASADQPHLVWGFADSRGSPQEEWGQRLDEALCAVNSLYAEALLVEKVIAPSRIIAIPSSVFSEKLRENLGIAQYKMKRLFASYSDFVTAYPTFARKAHDSNGS